MSYIHTIIKIRYSEEGYLPNYPPHLISDAEMCDGFLDYNYEEDSDEYWESYLNSPHQTFFSDNYPLLDESLSDRYRELVVAIAEHISLLKSSNEPDYKLPDWIYSYMIGSTIGVKSDKQDIHDLLVMMDIDNLEDEFLPEACESCYLISKYWVKQNESSRPPTIFGEPHVLKALRLSDASY